MIAARRELHLFAGIGGGILGGLILGHQPIGAVELNPYRRRILKRHQDAGHLPCFPIHDDIRTFDAKPWQGLVDIVCGGFPCQPWSAAGKQLGTKDPRHLWPEMARVIEECQPTFVFAENVALRAFREPLHDLQRLGYRVPPALCLSASDCGAPHRRNRWWILATNTNCRRQPNDAVGLRHDVPDPNSTGLAQRQGQPSHPCPEFPTALRTDWWATEPSLDRVANGVPNRVDRVASLGDAQLPLQAATAWQILKEQLAQ